MSKLKPEVFTPTKAPKCCPVCQKPSYSSAGIHPQCAVALADEPRRVRLVEEKKAKAVEDQLERDSGRPKERSSFGSNSSQRKP
jgi:hypothetical protein